MKARSLVVSMDNSCILVIFLSLCYVVHGRTAATSCATADDCPFLYCCVKPHGNSVDQQLSHAHSGSHGTDILIGKRASNGHCQSMKGPGSPCWTKTDVAYHPPHEMTDDCPCMRGLYCVANGIFLPGGQVGVCNV